MLVYVVAPLRGITGQAYMSDKLRYDAERWLATAIYDAKGDFVGTFDPRLDSRRDVNYTDAAIEIGDYTANPDHKSIPVREVPEHYWQCLVYHEDRYIGGPLNPYGIDLIGVLKIPYSTVRRSIALASGRASASAARRCRCSSRASSTRRRRARRRAASPSSSASSASGGWRPSSITS